MGHLGVWAWDSPQPPITCPGAMASTTGRCQGSHAPPRGAGPDEGSTVELRLGGPGGSAASEDLGPQQERSPLQGHRPVPSEMLGDSCHRGAAWALRGLMLLRPPRGTTCSRLPRPQQTGSGHRPPRPWPWRQGGQPSPPLGSSGGPGKGAGPQELGAASRAAAAPTPPASRRNSQPARQVWATGFRGARALVRFLKAECLAGRIKGDAASLFSTCPGAAQVEAASSQGPPFHQAGTPEPVCSITSPPHHRGTLVAA